MFSQAVFKEMEIAARRLGVEPAAIAAIAHAETGGKTHAIVNGRAEPLIRFESHYFDRRLSGARRDRARREGVSSPIAGAIANPPSQTSRWRLLRLAAGIDHKAAHESVSWGMGQVMGAHWAWLGYGSVDQLVETARSGVAGQLELMVRYIEKAGLSPALRDRNWTAFARRYNGPDYRKNAYHTKLARAYARYASVSAASIPSQSLRRGARGDTVSKLQAALVAKGAEITVDGIFGHATAAAVKAFQRENGLTEDGIAGPRTLSILYRENSAEGSLPSFLGRLLARLTRRWFDGAARVS
ncbi:N-acetylmuramidase domain-containing protein [Aquamicrobium sp. LC103]|uniref:N-acetylmuramidase domain-containing protein n=1 Tax=Aquamicrobium sp. LC103 TaxID=1120658 RepID=UPI00063EA283|nr:N-acetylmuramidase domain-containing protein [Aquamicrobium sp. LC103]TKT77526.1 DUF3380 domain-containing protein [Aquamicrobium sp. LC103]